MKTKYDILGSLKTKGSFVRNLFYTFSSNSLIYLMNILFYPLITYLFSPESYAEYAIWTILFNNITVVCVLGYPDSLVVAKSDQEFFQLGSAIGYLSIILVSILLLIFIFFGELFWIQFDHERIWWMYLVFPLSIVFTLQTLMYNGVIRFGLLERSAKVNSLSRLIGKICVLVVGWFGLTNGLGLVIGDLLFSFLIISFILPWSYVIRLFKDFTKFDLSGSIRILRKNIDYPKYVFPTIWLVILIQQLPLFFIGRQFTIDELGLYSFSLGILGFPVALVTKSIRPVFFQKNIELRGLNSNEQRLKIKELSKWLSIALFLYLVIGYWSCELLYDTLFSEKWMGGKELMKVLLIGMGGILLGSPMASIFKVNGKLKTDLFIRLNTLLILTVGCLLMAELNLNFIQFCLLFNAMYFVGFVILFTYQLKEFGFMALEISRLVIQILLVLTLSFLCTELIA